MTFLNGVLALGALAFVVPLAIHLLFRSRFKTVPWGAMHLLDAVVRTNRRRLQLTEILLLLLRCAIPILLACALARPVLTGFQALAGDAPQTVVLAIDDSRSMSATDESGQTAMQRATLAAKAYLERIKRQDEVILLRSSGASQPASTMGRDEALRQVAEMTPTANSGDLDVLARSAAAALTEASHLQRRVILVSDLRSRDVNDAVLDGLVPLQRTFAAMDPPPTVKILDVGDHDESIDNLFVDSITLDSQVAVTKRLLRLAARVRNDTDRHGNDVSVKWWVDGREIESQRIAVQPRATSVAKLSFTFETSGLHTVRVSVEWPDSLVADNQRQLAVTVIDGVEVLLVDGEPSREPLEGETDFLAIALSPFGFGASSLPDAVRSRTIKGSDKNTAKKIDEELRKSPADAIVLANVPEIDEPLKSLLANYVVAGGALVVFDGDLLNAADYNAPWTAGNTEYHLPSQLGNVLGNPLDRDTAGAKKPQLNKQFATWSSVFPASDSAMDEVDIYAFRELKIPSKQAAQTDKPSSLATTLLQTAQGEPLAIMTDWGEGRVVQFGFSCDGEWTTLPLRPVFLPLMQQLLIDLASVGRSANVRVGDTLNIAVDEFGELIDNATYTVEPPLAKEIEVQVVQVPGENNRKRLVAAANQGVGEYLFRRTTKDTTGTSSVATTLRVAEVDSDESLLRAAGSERTDALAKRLGATLHTDGDSLVNDDRVDRFGREVWRWVLAALLFAMLGELFLQQRRLATVKPKTIQAAGVLR